MTKPESQSEEDPDEKMLELVGMMTAEMGRFPTEQEVMSFIFGDMKTRNLIILNAKREGTSA